MKRTTPWRDDESDGTSSGDESSSPDTSSEDEKRSTKTSAKNSKGSPRVNLSQVKSAKGKSKGIDFAALSRHGYKGGLSVLNVPPPKDPNDGKQDWSWSKGQESRAKDIEETYVERQKTRAAIIEGEQLVHVRTQKEKKNVSYSQREKKKRDLGQSSRGKNYVEEEKRLLRDNGVYSGFDS